MKAGTTIQDSATSLPKMKSNHCKGQNGLVLVTVGSSDYVCVPALSGILQIRAGCGIVRIGGVSG